jgi:predicted dehydrogenase
MQILNAGYDMLMEKPIVPNAERLREIESLAKEKGAKVFVCHVLRYTPFYRKIKELLNAGTIGDIVTMELNEHVCRPHFMSSYVRGKWNSEETCGSGFLLAKSCHDLDLICWLNNASVPEKVASLGNRSKFIPQNAPEGATEYCYQCKHEKNCPYSALDLYLEKNAFDFLVWDRLNKPLDEITDEEKAEFLKQDIYGKCAYTCGGDIVDRQNLIIGFENGSLATFNMVGGSTRASRFIHIVGTLGEIEGVLETNEITLRTYARDALMGKTETIDVHPISNAKDGGHSGGDYAIMHDLVRYLNGDKSSISITSIEDSVNGHLCVYAAEESRKSERFVSIKEDLL